MEKESWKVASHVSVHGHKATLLKRPPHIRVYCIDVICYCNLDFIKGNFTIGFWNHNIKMAFVKVILFFLEILNISYQYRKYEMNKSSVVENLLKDNLCLELPSMIVKLKKLKAMNFLFIFFCTVLFEIDFLLIECGGTI